MYKFFKVITVLQLSGLCTVGNYFDNENFALADLHWCLYFIPWHFGFGGLSNIARCPHPSRLLEDQNVFLLSL